MSIFSKLFDFIRSIFCRKPITDSTYIIPNSSKVALWFAVNDYPGTQNDLRGCVNDANGWTQLLSSQYGYSTRTCLNENATRSNVLNNIKDLVNQAKSGKITHIVIGYSGHGSSVIDTDGDEDDGRDETLYVYDGNITDDELRNVFSELPPTTKLTCVFDSCHSGTVTREMLNAVRDVYTNIKYMPPKDEMETNALASLPLKRQIMYSEEGMSHVLIAGCLPVEYSYDANFGGIPNGSFSYYAIQTLRKTPMISYDEFYRLLRQQLPSPQYGQTPQLEGPMGRKQEIIFS